MRSLLSAIAAVGVLTTSFAQAEQCARPAEKVAFDVAGLKSQLMVTAITCQMQDKYNNFVLRYRPSLVSQEQVLNAYFRHAFGRSAQKQHDDYVTLLANSQSQLGIKSGTLFCQRNVGLFDEVLALKDGKDLPTYATGKSLPQPIPLADCPAKPTIIKVTRTAKK